ncbi:hypothetical protein [Novosphingobium sp. ST904]|uniref:hypothetical protein n=1 Tax=Novosphingobium sp. ST904 TaxID=1684385 RepID=UPI0006C88F8F|nr:hypothetical protein [Novosphingobium sp. ST904]
MPGAVSKLAPDSRDSSTRAPRWRLCGSSSSGDPPMASSQPVVSLTGIRNSHPVSSDSTRQASPSSSRSNRTCAAPDGREPNRRMFPEGKAWPRE